MATLSVQQISRTGITPTYGSCAGGGDEFVNSGEEFIHIKNGHTSPQTVTIATPATVDGLAVADRPVEVTNAEERIIGPFPVSTYNDANGKVQLTYDGVVSLTIAIFKPGT
jgi:hypothetical protein